MIPCRICGKDASTHWITGFPPAPDSQKIGLCTEHDTPINRKKITRLWKQMLTQKIAETITVPQIQSEYLVVVVFMSGEAASYTCTHVLPTDHGTLQITTLDDTHVFIPITQVKTYTVSPMPKAKET